MCWRGTSFCRNAYDSVRHPLLLLAWGVAVPGYPCVMSLSELPRIRGIAIGRAQHTKAPLIVNCELRTGRVGPPSSLGSHGLHSLDEGFPPFPRCRLKNL